MFLNTNSILVTNNMFSNFNKLKTIYIRNCSQDLVIKFKSQLINDNVIIY